MPGINTSARQSVLLLRLSGHTLTELANRSGLSISHVSLVVAGHRSPTLRFLRTWRAMHITERGLTVARELLSEFSGGTR